MILSFFTLFLALGTNTVNAQYVDHGAAIEILSQEANYLASNADNIRKSGVQLEINRLPVKQEAVKRVLLQLLDGESVAIAIENVIGSASSSSMGASTSFSKQHAMTNPREPNYTWLAGYLNNLLGS